MKKKLRCLALILALAMTLGISGCGKQEIVFSKESTSCANIVMGEGRFAAYNGFIYFSNLCILYEYDTETGKTAELLGDDRKYLDPYNLFVTEDFVGYTSFGGLQYVTKDGKRTGDLLTRVEEFGIASIFVDGEFVYYPTTDGLVRQKLATGEVSLLLAGDVRQYFVDEDYIYAIKFETTPTENTGSEAPDEYEDEETEEKDNFECSLLRSPKDTVAFEEIPLSFEPIRVYTCKEGMFLSKKGDWQIIQYADGKETPLPIYSWYYQVLDGHMIFHDGKNSTNTVPSTDTLRSYDLATGEIKLICENVHQFCVLSDRYICCWVWEPDGSESWILYDWNTGTSVTMHQFTPVIYAHG